jgi:hypothetical protein
MGIKRINNNSMPFGISSRDMKNKAIRRFKATFFRICNLQIGELLQIHSLQNRSDSDNAVTA